MIVRGNRLRDERGLLGAGSRFHSAEVVAYDGKERTVTLRFGWMPEVGVGDEWQVRCFPRDLPQREGAP